VHLSLNMSEGSHMLPLRCTK